MGISVGPEVVTDDYVPMKDNEFVKYTDCRTTREFNPNPGGSATFYLKVTGNKHGSISNGYYSVCISDDTSTYKSPTHVMPTDGELDTSTISTYTSKTFSKNARSASSVPTYTTITLYFFNYNYNLSYNNSGLDTNTNITVDKDFSDKTCTNTSVVKISFVVTSTDASSPTTYTVNF